MARGKRIHHLILADAHQLFRCGLRSLISAEEDLKVAEEVATVEALMLALESPVDFLVMDVGMLSGVPNLPLQELRQRLVAIPSLFLSAEDRPENLSTAMQAGSRAYMLKSTPPAALISAIRKVAAGLEMQELESTADLKALAESGRKNHRPELLTNREQEILRLLAEGRTVRDAAGELALSIKTVEAHKLNLMRKLNIHNRASLVEYAAQNGYVAAALPA